MSLGHHIAKASSPLFMFTLFMIGTFNLAFADSAAELIVLNQPVQIGSDLGSGSQLLSSWLSSHCPPGSPACGTDTFTFQAKTIAGSGLRTVGTCHAALNFDTETCQLKINQSNYPNDFVRTLLISALVAAVQKGQTQKTINGFDLDSGCADIGPPKCNRPPICGMPSSMTSWSIPGQQRIIAYNKPLNQRDTAEQGEIWYTMSCAVDTFSPLCPQGLTGVTGAVSTFTGTTSLGPIPGLLNGLLSLFCGAASLMNSSPTDLLKLTPAQ